MRKYHPTAAGNPVVYTSSFVRVTARRTTFHQGVWLSVSISRSQTNRPDRCVVDPTNVGLCSLKVPYKTNDALGTLVLVWDCTATIILGQEM